MSGPRYTVEYTGGGGDDADGSRRSEPAFIRQFKQRAGLQPEAKLADKFANNSSSCDSKSGRGLGKPQLQAESDDSGREPAARTEEEMPQIVLSADSGISEAELAAVQARMREAGEEAKFDEARSRVRFVRPALTGDSRKTKLGGAVISASSADNSHSDEASLPKRSRQQASPSAASAKSVCNKKLLSFDEEEDDDS